MARECVQVVKTEVTSADGIASTRTTSLYACIPHVSREMFQLDGRRGNGSSQLTPDACAASNLQVSDSDCTLGGFVADRYVVRSCPNFQKTLLELGAVCGFGKGYRLFVTQNTHNHP